MPADPAITAALRAAREAYLHTMGRAEIRHTAAIAAFLRALPQLSMCPRLSCCHNGAHSAASLAAAVEEAARDA